MREKFKKGEIVTAKRTFNGEFITGEFRGYHLFNDEIPDTVVGVVHVPGDGVYDVDVTSIRHHEGEDEKITKAFIHGLKNDIAEHRYETIYGIKLEGALAWFEKQKEQKPNIVPKTIRPKFAVGDTVCRPMWSDHTIREIYIHCDDPVYVCVNDEGTESHISFSEQDEWKRKEKKSAEWSEDKFPKDIEADAVQFCFDNGINITPYQAKQIATHYLMVGHNEGYLEGRKNAHIPARELGLPSSCDFQKEQKPAEWSEEEKKFLQVAISCTYDRGYLSVSNWLKSLCPQPKAEWSEDDENNLNKLLQLDGIPLGLRSWVSELPEKVGTRPH